MKAWIKKLFDITFWKFILVGAINTLVGTGIMFLFYDVFHFSYWISSASNYIFASILSYFLNRLFTFGNKQDPIRTLPKFIANISLCYLIAYGAARPLVRWLLTNCSITVQENIAMLVGMCLFVGLNYIGQRFFVFRDRTSHKN